YFLIARNDSLVSSTRHLFHLRPAYQFSPVEKLKLTAGLNVAVQNDQYPGSKSFHLYPHVQAQYELGKNVEAYGVVTGDMDKVDLHSMSAENLWINSNLPVLHTNRAIEFKAGLKGKFSRNVAFDAGLDVATLKNYYYYLNLDASGSVPVLFNRFNVTYDANTSRVNPYAEISYSKTETFRLSLRGDYFTYTTESVLQPFHRPTYRGNINMRYNLYDKILIEAGLITQGGMKAFDSGLNTVTLDAAVDVNLKARYFISKEISAFLQFDNILSNNYPLYQSYPVRGFQVLGGISWSF
ncbi:MAG TPA: hypothetical protein PLR06_14595, partial [Cyclobacteriaceae bacterium]|nr:hypothetical protein [Cyclobacteriaceae bacterium]